MRTVPMCFSVLHAPRCRIHAFANSWCESFSDLRRTFGKSSGFKLFASKTYGNEGGWSKQWSRRTITTKTDETNKATRSSESAYIRQKILDGKVPTSASLSGHKSEISEVQKVSLPDIRQQIAENKDMLSLVTVIVFDIETTGFVRDGRIIEVAFQDLHGGVDSTFETLVNPGCHVPNSDVHGITTSMVCRPDVPRMEELIPILLNYVSNRQKPGGYVLFVAHNARSFDLPFIIREFDRCFIDVPSNWLFLDTLPLARELMKSLGLKRSSKLSSLCELWSIPSKGAHRAMADVNTLSLVFQRLTFQLKLSLRSLILKSILPSEVKVGKKISR